MEGLFTSLKNTQYLQNTENKGTMP